MPEFDLPLEQLRTYLPERREPQDWQSFWDTTLAETREHDLAGDPTEQRPYYELIAFLCTHRSQAETALRTIDYVDGITMAAHATAPAKFSIALMDTICPPSGGFGVYNHYAGAKQLDVYPFNNHEGGEADEQLASIRWLQDVWG